MTVMEVESQHMRALGKANMVRVRRAELKRQIGAGRVSVGEVLARPPVWVGSMPVLDLLLPLPGVGRVKAKRWLRVCGLEPSKPVGELTVRQRQALRSVLVGRTG